MNSYILAIDTSCDDSSAAVVRGTEVLSNVITTQSHVKYGGVFPTVAKQEHLKNTRPVALQALEEAGLDFHDLAAIAVTQGPGLAPSLEVGINVAKELCTEFGLPLIAVNHIEGHALSPLATPRGELLIKNLDSLRETGQMLFDRYFAKPVEQLEFPVLSLVVSGGHTDFILIEKIGEYKRLGFTVDDAAGEALDKFGRLVELPYPAGALIEQLAAKGDAHKFKFPIPMTTSGNFNVSFAGLKTSVKTLIENLKASNLEGGLTESARLTEQQVLDLCASFQFAVFRAITYKLEKIQKEYHFGTIFLGGGVAANQTLRKAITETTGLPLYVPYSMELCRDNAAMIGLVAGYKLERGEILKTEEELTKIERLPDWKIDVTPIS